MTAGGGRTDGDGVVEQAGTNELWWSWLGLAAVLASPFAAAMACCLARPAAAGGVVPHIEDVPSAVAWAALRVTGLAGWQRHALAFGAGTLSVLAMAPFFLTPVLFVTLPILVWLIDGAGKGPAVVTWRCALRAAVCGWWFGFGYFLAGLYWIGQAFLVEAEVFAWLLPFAVTLMPVGLALFYAGAAGAARLLWCRGQARVARLAIALAFAEWLRGHVFTGFPWNTLGYALTYPLPLMQWAAFFGIYALTLLGVMLFADPLVRVADRQAAGERPALLAAAGRVLVPFAILLAVGSLLMAWQPTKVDDSVRLRIVQPSIPQREKWQREKQAANFALHLDLSRQAPDGRRDDLAGITHVIWPEAAMPFLPLETPEALSAIAALLPQQTYLLTGSLRRERPPEGGAQPQRIFNSLLALAPGAGLTAVYDKIHLVPFGEYLPFQTTLEAIGLQQLTKLRGGFAGGVTPRPLLDIPGLPPVAPLICYEAIFPTELIQGLDRPGLLVNVTNDGWFGNSIGPHQHLHQARVRAVEQGLPLIRAANNGISAIIDPQGRVLARLGLDVRGTLDTALPRAAPPTLYAKVGEGSFAILVVALAAAAWLTRRRDRGQSTGSAQM
jgi:apolipoprotein N-acyltransferase